MHLIILTFSMWHLTKNLLKVSFSLHCSFLRRKQITCFELQVTHNKKLLPNASMGVQPVNCSAINSEASNWTYFYFSSIFAEALYSWLFYAIWVSTNFFQNIPNMFLNHKKISLCFSLIDCLQVYIEPAQELITVLIFNHFSILKYKITCRHENWLSWRCHIWYGAFKGCLPTTFIWNELLGSAQLVEVK